MSTPEHGHPYAATGQEGAKTFSGPSSSWVLLVIFVSDPNLGRESKAL